MKKGALSVRAEGYLEAGMVQKWIGHDPVPFARGEDEEDDDGEGDGDLIEHEPERVQIRGRA